MQPDYDRIQGHTRRLATFSASLTYEDIPREVITKVKHLLLDTLGTTLAATTLGAGCREVTQVMRAVGGKPESTILGFGDKVAAGQSGTNGRAGRYSADEYGFIDNAHPEDVERLQQQGCTIVEPK
jgi:2-methylcitrate dehydratase PrpD